MRGLIINEIFTHYDSKVKEGFRRLGMIVGLLAAVYMYICFDNYTDYVFKYVGELSGLLLIVANFAASFVTFVVAALLVKMLGWVTEGFLGHK